MALIPARFKFVNRTWRVKLCTEQEMDRLCAEDGYDFEARGLCDPYDAIIYLNPSAHTCHEDLVHTFFHEVGHAYLFAQGYFSRKQHNEHEVDKFGAMMAQFWTTCEGEQHLDSRTLTGIGRRPKRPLRRRKRRPVR